MSPQWTQWRAPAAVFSANLTAGMCWAWWKTARPRLTEHGDGPFTLRWGESETLLLVATLAVPVGAVLAATLLLLAGSFRLPLLLSPLLLVCSSSLTYFASSVELVYGVQACTGVAVGLCEASALVYLCETAPPRSRGQQCTLVLVAPALGGVLQRTLGPALEYRRQALVALPVAALSLALVFAWAVESPYELAAKHKDKVSTALARLRGVAFTEAEAQQVVKTVDEDSPCGWVQPVLVVLVLATALPLTGRSTFLANRSRLLALVLAHPVSDASALALLDGLHCVGGLLGLLLVDSVGRRPLIVISCVLASGCLSTVGLFLYFAEDLHQDMSAIAALPLSLMVTHAVVHGLGLQLVWLLDGELLPVRCPWRCRALVPVAAVALHALGSFLVVDWAGRLTLPPVVPFTVLAVCCLGLAAFTVAALPETRGKSLAEVQHALRKAAAGRHIMK